MRAPGVLAISAALLGTVVVAPAKSAPVQATPFAAADPPAEIASLSDELEQETDGRATVAIRDESGTATFVGGSKAAPLSPRRGSAAQTARQFVDHYAPMFGVDDPTTDLTESAEFNSPEGGSVVRYQQRHHGVPVLAGEVAVQLGADGSVLSTSGEASPALDVDVTPTVNAADAAEAARAMTAKYDRVEPELLTVSDPALWIYDPALIGGDDPAGTRLVWRADVRTELGDVDRFVLVDAHTGSIALQFSQREDAKDRVVCDNNNVAGASATCSSPVRSEGQAATGLSDVDSAYDLSGVVYDFYSTVLGRDSINGNGMQIRSTVRYCPSMSNCPYKNAFWNGSQMVYGQGYTVADDVVGHELTHGVTQYTSKLLYYAESGAINESMSDVMGELIDLWNVGPFDTALDRWLMGEQIPGGAIRSMKDPTQFGDPDKMTSSNYRGGVADNRGVHTNNGVNNKAAFLITDGATFNGQTVTGIGIEKTAHIYYTAETTLLGPGSDYLDLYYALQQACINLIGSFGITSDDCAQVAKAVTATEMNQFPTAIGAHLGAPLCDGNQVQKTVLFTDRS
ncbi:MAG TPA: M4 family metallopeptidase, partial [Ilumatobacteraceae bacterium]